MLLIVLGLGVFVAVHVLPTLGGLRAGLAARLGENGYKLAHSLLSVLGIGLIVVGWRAAPYQPLYAPPVWGHWVPFVVMPFVLFLLIGRRMRSNLRRYTRHPMLWAIVLWAGAHLLANGDRAGVLLFGTLLGYALFAMRSQDARGRAALATERSPIAVELKVAAIALVVYCLLIYAHHWYAGPALVG